MADNFANFVSGLEGPASFAAAVTPSDTVDLATVARNLYVGGTGTVKVNTVGGSTVTFSAVPAGSILPVRVSRVFATGTTATLIISLW